MSTLWRVRASAVRLCSGSESSRCQPVGADVSEERPQFRLPCIRELQEIVDDALQLGNVVLLEEGAGAGRAKGDGVQRLRHTVV